jgi:hypothetical protein
MKLQAENVPVGANGIGTHWDKNLPKLAPISTVWSTACLVTAQLVKKSLAFY